MAVKGESGQIVVTLVKAGDHYDETNGYTAGNFSIYVDGSDKTPSGNWKVGQPFTLTVTSAGEHHVTVQIWGTTVYDGTVITY